MDIIKDKVGKLTHAIVVGDSVENSASSPVNYFVYNFAGDIVASGEATLITATPYNYYEATIGPDVTANTGKYEIEWVYDIITNDTTYNMTPREQFSVVVPYVGLAEMMSFPELASYAAKELRAMERLVAGIIDVYTNQTFNREDNLSVTILGQDSDQLALPRRIINLDTVSVLDYDEAIDPYPITEYVKFDTDNRWILRRRKDWDVDRKINPVSSYRFFKYPTLYQVTGDWGWDFVPQDVSRAAGILIKEYFCEDAKYRDKFIDNIRAGDWRMEFKVTGDETTGSANADMLLTGYRNVGLAVI